MSGPANGEHVILLHGLGRTDRSMAKMAERLTEQGYAVTNLDYPSRKAPIEQLSDEFLHAAVQTALKGSPARVHFVTHSLGGIVVRYYLGRHEVANLGRVVMLAPPNQGSEVADRLHDTFYYRWSTGPAGQQLTTGPESFADRLGPVAFDCGVIAGSSRVNPFFAWWVPGPSDGTVPVERARVEGMKDFLIVPCSHTFIMRDKEVIRQTEYFLRTGRFDKA